MEFNVDCSPNATPMFEGRRGGEDIEAELGGLFSKFYQSDQICDRKKLCVVEGSWCWALYIDILGNYWVKLVMFNFFFQFWNLAEI